MRYNDIIEYITLYIYFLYFRYFQMKKDKFLSTVKENSYDDSER